MPELQVSDSWSLRVDGLGDLGVAIASWDAFLAATGIRMAAVPNCGPRNEMRSS